MSDLIRRQDAIDVIKKWFEFIELNPDILIDSIISLPSTEPERKWIPVTEALPEEKEIVLITNNKGHVRCGQYQGTFEDKNYRWWWKHNTLEEVIAWMPLPEPYRGE